MSNDDQLHTRRAPVRNKDEITLKIPAGGIRRLVGGTVDETLTPARGRVTIGRGQFNDLVVNHSTLSAVHAVIFFDKQWFLVDLGSTNGTQVLDATGHPVAVSRRGVEVEDGREGRRIPLRRGYSISFSPELKIEIG